MPRCYHLPDNDWTPLSQNPRWKAMICPPSVFTCSDRLRPNTIRTRLAGTEGDRSFVDDLDWTGYCKYESRLVLRSTEIYPLFQRFVQLHKLRGHLHRWSALPSLFGRCIYRVYDRGSRKGGVTMVMWKWLVSHVFQLVSHVFQSTAQFECHKKAVKTTWKWYRFRYLMRIMELLPHPAYLKLSYSV